MCDYAIWQFEEAGAQKNKNTEKPDSVHETWDQGDELCERIHRKTGIGG